MSYGQELENLILKKESRAERLLECGIGYVLTPEQHAAIEEYAKLDEGPILLYMFVLLTVKCRPEAAHRIARYFQAQGRPPTRHET